MQNPFLGSIPALPTPMRGGTIDLDDLATLVEAHVAHESSGVVVCGTTGESATLSADERAAVLARALEAAAGRLPVIAGVGTNDTRETVRRAREAESAGADGLLVVTPYYNKPGPNGLMAHFSGVADATSLPVVLYNVPGRTGCDLEPYLVRELRSRHTNVVAIKEASSRPERALRLADIDGLDLLCGEDSFLAECLRLGAVGTISVMANVAPDAVAALCREAAPAGDPARAAELERALAPLARGLFLESNPVPLKYVLERLGWCSSEVRLPLVGLEAMTRRLLDQALSQAGDLLMRPAPLPDPS